MTRYDLYVFFLCTVVFVTLTALFSVLLASVIKLTVRTIRSGLDDEALLKEKSEAEAQSRKARIFDQLLSVCGSLVLTLLLVVTLLVNVGGLLLSDHIPVMQVVKSDSMAQKNSGNTYLTEHTLDDQIEMFDIVFTHKLPDEFDLKLYDIVVYQTEELQIIHRIVGIEEPNEAHPGERRFILQGDAVDSPDRFPVRYAQMKSIYTGKKIPFAGSFVMFMQSPAGWLCILLVLFAMIGSPVVEKRITKEKELRLKQIEAEKRRAEADKKNQTEACI